MELSSEDSLRLNVLIKNVEAIRIDEQALAVYGLSPRGEAKVQLSPNCRPDQYLRKIRQFFSGAILGSPGGYPVHLMRWTRMGQISGNLEELLMLGEPEAVAAVACAPGLTDDLARRVWWIEPTSENARRMLARPDIVRGAMGKVLADHLVEHLPFETEPGIMLDTVRLVLQPGLIDSATRMKLWERGARQVAYRVAFLETLPDELPDAVPDYPLLASHQSALQPLADAGNPFARVLLDTLAMNGQTFVRTCAALVVNTGDPEVAAALLNTIGNRFAPACLSRGQLCDINAVVQTAEELCAGMAHAPLRALLDAAPALKPQVAALLALSHVSEAVATSILAQTTATGSLLKRKLAPVTGVIAERLGLLRGEGSNG